VGWTTRARLVASVALAGALAAGYGWMTGTVVRPAVGQGPGPIDVRLARVLEASGPAERIPVLVQVDRRALPMPLSPSRDLRAAEHASDLAAVYAASVQDLRDAVPVGLSSDISSGNLIWVGGAIAVELSTDQVRALAATDNVQRLYYDGLIEVPLRGSAAMRRVPAPAFLAAQNPDGGLPPGLVLIGAPTLWSSGATGQGTVVAIIDSGVDGDHPLLRRSWRGHSTSADQAWFDPWGLSATPIDDDGTVGIGHGTIVATVAVGSLAPGDTLFTPAGGPLFVEEPLEIVTGVAPGAEWIAANAFEGFGGASYTRLSVLLQSMQWVLDPDGDPASITDVPDVVNNSWGFSPGGCDDVFDRAIDALELAGIPVVFAAGNRSAGFDTVAAPAERADLLLNAFAVGAVEIRDGAPLVSPNSLGGPSPCNPGSVKPEVVAPGQVPLVRRRTDNAAEVRGLSGAFTSWAAPHATGALAILRGLNPGASANELKNALFSTAVDLPPAGLDNESGAGVIDLVAAAGRVGGLGGARLALSGWDWRSAEGRLDVRLRSSGPDGFPGGVAELFDFTGNARLAQGVVPAIAPGAAATVSFSDLPAELADDARLSLRLRSLGAELSFALRLASATLTSTTLEDGQVRFSLDGNGRFGQVTGAAGFELGGADWLTGGSFLFTRGDGVSDAAYVDVLQQPDLKSRPVGSDTDWRSLQATSAGRTGEFRYADDRALRPLGATVSQVVELVALGDSGAYALLSETPTLTGGGGNGMAALLLDWDFPQGDSVAWDAALGASVMSARGGGGPWMALTTHPRPPSRHAAVPLGTPDDGFYAVGSDAGVLAQLEGFTDERKSRFIRLGGRQTSTPDVSDWSQLVSAGPLGSGERVDFIVAAGLSREALVTALAEARTAADAAGGAGPSALAGELELLPPYPNPFDPTAGEVIAIPYLLARSAQPVQARLRVFTISGRLVYEERQALDPTAPLEAFRWDGRLRDGDAAASGVYGYVLEVAGQKRSGKLVLLK